MKKRCLQHIEGKSGLTRREFVGRASASLIVPTFYGLLGNNAKALAEGEGIAYIEFYARGGWTNARSFVMTDKGKILSSYSAQGVIENPSAPGSYSTQFGHPMWVAADPELSTLYSQLIKALPNNAVFNNNQSALRTKAREPGRLQFATQIGSIGDDGSDGVGIVSTAAEAMSRYSEAIVPALGTENSDSGSRATAYQYLPSFKPATVTSLDVLQQVLRPQQGPLVGASSNAMRAFGEILKQLSGSQARQLLSDVGGTDTLKTLTEQSTKKNADRFAMTLNTFDPRTDPLVAPFFGLAANTATTDPRVVTAGMCLAILRSYSIAFAMEVADRTDYHGKGTSWKQIHSTFENLFLIPTINAFAEAGKPLILAFTSGGAHSMEGQDARSDKGEMTAEFVLAVNLGERRFVRDSNGSYTQGQIADPLAWLGGDDPQFMAGARAATLFDAMDPTGQLADAKLPRQVAEYSLFRKK